ncbi:MAG: hypothetical protein RLZZ184_2492 [Cyanobacteriota bacterium]|jgi:type I restriction enzyme S subunit
MSDELLDLPEGWCEVFLSEITHRITKGTTPTSLGFNFIDSGILFVKVESIYNERINHNLCAFIGYDADEALSRSRLETGDILFSIAGTLGRIAVVQNNDLPANTNQALAIIRLIKPIFSDYIAKFLSSNLLNQSIQDSGRGVGLQNINLKQVSEFKIPLPPLNEQKRIVAKIEGLRDRSQAAQKALETIPQLCDRFRQSVLAAAFRGDLTADWREKNPDVEPASVLLERIKKERRQKWEEEELKKFKASGKIPKDDKWKEKYKEPQELEKIDNVELSKLPDGWLWMSADECTSWITDGEHATPERSDSGVYLLSARNVLDGKISLQKVDFISEQVHKKLEERLKIESGDVFLSCSGTVGRSCVVPPDLKCSLVRSVAVLKPLFNMGQYLSLAIRSPCIQAQIEGKKTQTAQSNIFQGRIKILAIPVAPLNEQKQIVFLIQKYFKIIETIEKQHQQATEKLEKLNQSILSKAFRGELVPQDPEDEPASVLLERIRAEREKINNNKPKSTSKRKSKTPKEQGTIPGLE